MRCPKCGYISFDHLSACKKCGRSLGPTAAMVQGTCFEASSPLFLALMGQKKEPAAVAAEDDITRLPDGAPPAGPGGKVSSATSATEQEETLPLLDLGGGNAEEPAASSEPDEEIMLLLDDEEEAPPSVMGTGSPPVLPAESEFVLSLDDGDDLPVSGGEIVPPRPVKSFADIDITDLAPPAREAVALTGARTATAPRLEPLELAELTSYFAEPAATLRSGAPRVTMRTNTPLDDVVFDLARFRQGASPASDEKRA